VQVNLPTGGTGTYTYKINNGAAQPLSAGTLNLPAQNTKGDFNLEVFQGTKKVGKLKLVVFEQKEINVVVVPLVSSTPTKTELETALNKTLGEANLKFNVTLAPQWNNNTFTNSKTVQLPEEVGLMNKYSEEMKTLRNTYFEDSTALIEENAFYLFVVPDFSDNATDGYMVRGKSLGFVAANANLQTYVHELGHGVGALKHSWQDNGPAQGMTSNLMDYSEDATNLIKAQWKQIRSWNLMPSMWDEAEDGEGAGGNVHYYEVKIRYTSEQKEQIVSRTYLGRYQWIKQGTIGSETSTKGTYTTGVNKFLKEVNGTWTPYRYEHFGKVFYMDEITDNEGARLRYSTTYYNKDYLRRELGGEEEAPNGIYQGVSMYLEGQTAPYSREIRNYELKPVIDHYRSGNQYKQIIYFNDLELSNQFREKYQLMQSGGMTYGDLVLWLESHPRKHTDTRWNLSAKQNAVNHLKSYTNDFDRGPVYNQYFSSWTTPYLRPFEYHENTNQTYVKGIIAYVLKVNGSAWIRESIEIEPSGYYKSGAGENAIHAQYGASNCSHSLTSETAQVNGLLQVLNNQDKSAKDLADYINSKDFCFLYGLNITDRKKVLLKIISDDGSWIRSNRNILNEVILTARQDDEKAILDYLIANNSYLLKQLTTQLSEYFDFANNNDLTALFRVAKTISLDLIKYKSSYPNTKDAWEFSYSVPAQTEPLTNLSLPSSSYTLPFPKIAFPIVIGGNAGSEIELGAVNGLSVEYGEQAGIKLKLQSGHTPYPLELGEDGKIHVNQNYKVVEYFDGLYFKPQGSTTTEEDIAIYEVTAPYDLQPYDYVDVIIGANYGAAGYNQGDIIQVPLITALLIQQAIENNKFNQQMRVAIDIVEVTAGVVAAVSAIPTGGASVASYVAIVAGLKGAVDLAIVSHQNTLPTAQYNADFYKSWEKISLAVDVATGLYALPGLAKGVVKIGSKTIHHGRALVMAMSMRRAVRLTKLSNNATDIYDLERARAISRSFRQKSLINGFEVYVNGAGDVVRGINKSDFIATVGDFANGAKAGLADEAWTLWKNQDWNGLEEMFRINNINFDASIQNVWPPMYGFKSITSMKTGSELDDLIFDRFQKESSLGGGYASPVPTNNSVYSLPSRALGVNYDDLIDLGQDYYYFKFKIVNPPSDLTFKYGEAAPWFNEIGGAIQIKSSKGFQNLTNHIEIVEKWKFSNGQWTKIL
jgi:hypothetical protein